MSKISVKTSATGDGILTLNVPETNESMTLDFPLNSTKLIGDEGGDFQSMPSVGGAPIVESGSNSDGEWTRWADGTQHCSQQSLVRGGEVWTYPQAFVSTDTTTVLASPGTSAARTTGIDRNSTTNTSTYIACWMLDESSSSAPVSSIATGRWK